MLPEEINRSITSIDEPELEELYLKFCEKSGTDKDDEFVSELYNSDRINTEELKSFQFLKKIEFTAVADISNVNVVDAAHMQLRVVKHKPTLPCWNPSIRVVWARS